MKWKVCFRNLAQSGPPSWAAIYNHRLNLGLDMPIVAPPGCKLSENTTQTRHCGFFFKQRYFVFYLVWEFSPTQPTHHPLLIVLYTIHVSHLWILLVLVLFKQPLGCFTTACLVSLLDRLQLTSLNDVPPPMLPN